MSLLDQVMIGRRIVPLILVGSLVMGPGSSAAKPGNEAHIVVGVVDLLEAPRGHYDGLNRKMALNGYLLHRLNGTIACGADFGYYALGYDEYGVADGGGAPGGHITYGAQQVGGLIALTPIHSVPHLRILAGASFNRFRSRPSVLREGFEWLPRIGASCGAGLFRILGSPISAQARWHIVFRGNELPGDRDLDFMALCLGAEVW